MLTIAPPPTPGSQAPPDSGELDRLVRDELRHIAGKRGTMLIFGAAAMVLFVFADHALVGRWVPQMVASRLVFAVLAVGVAVALPRSNLALQRVLLSLIGLAVIATVVVVVWYTGGARSPFMIALVLVPFGMAMVLPGDQLLAAAASAGNLVAGLIVHANEGQLFLASNWVAMSLVIGAMVVFLSREEHQRRRLRQGFLLEQRRQVDEINASQDRLLAVFETSPDPITILDFADLRYVLANPAFCALTGWAEGEVLGHTADELGIFSLARLRDAIKARLDIGTAFSAAATITTRDGRVRHVTSFARHITLGGRSCLLSFLRDETDALAAEQARAAIGAELERVHAQLRQVIDNAPLVFFALDASGAFSLSDGKGLVRLGVRSGGLVGKRPAEVWADAPELVAACERGLQGLPCVITARHERLQQAWQLWWAPVKGPDGTGAGAVCVGFEVTDRVAAEQSLEASEASFRQLIDRLPDIIGVETDGRIVYVNQAGRQQLGYDEAQLRGRSLAALMHPDDPAPAEGTSGERRLVRADGSELWVEDIALRAVFGGRPSTIAIARDTTDRRKMEERLRISDRMASVGTLAAGVAHEINNPLSYIISSIDYARELAASLREQGSPAQVLDELDAGLRDAETGATRVRNIVRDLKTFSHPDESAQQDLDVQAVIESSINMAWTQIRHRARLERAYAPGLPRVRGNHARLGQVVLNLLVNAAQAMPEGESDRHLIRVATRLDAAAGQVVLEITDDGCGISPEHLKRIFDPFFTTKEVGVGTGLGLSICLGIVRAMGGEIQVASAKGRGTTFTVRLAPASPPAASAKVPGAATTPVVGPQGQVWVVDDDPFVLRSLARQLGSAHHLRTFASASAVLAAVDQGARFDLLICDVMMPEVSGMQLHEAMRSRSPSLAERMVFLTGGAFTPAAAEFVAARHHLEKPVDAATLRSFTRAFLRGERPEAPGNPPRKS